MRLINKSIIKKIMISCLIAFFLLAIVFFVLLERKLNQPINLSTPAMLTVTSGMSISSLSKQLVKNDWIDERFWLRSYARIYPDKVKIKVGTFKILPPLSSRDLLAQLVTGKEHQFSMTFIEGTTFKQWLSQLSQQSHLQHTLVNVTDEELAQKLSITSSNLEGWFFPETYSFTVGTSDFTVLKWAHSKMKNTLEQLWQDRAVGLPYDNIYQALIMASIIEKESSLTDELPLIASVFVNRLRKKMRLQTDPTVIYGLGDRYQGDIKRSHLREKTPYNTYRINGLPPTPIAMPGLAALTATLHPDTSDYLYFVSKGNGSHIFSSTLAEHNKAVARYQLGIKH